MKPGKFDEQPIPLMVTTLWFGICNSTRAFWTAASTPKSPHPGHQSGSTLPFKSANATWLVSARAVAIFCSPQTSISSNTISSNMISSNTISSNKDFVCRHRELGLATQLFLYSFDDVVGHERFPVILSDVPVRYEAGFAAQVTGELAAVVVLHNDRVPRALEDVENRLSVQWHEPADLELIGRNALLDKDLAGLLNHSFRGAPTNQGDVRITRAPQLRWRHCGFNSRNLPHALFHHGPAFGWIRELVADQNPVFVVLITRSCVSMTEYSGNGARRDSAFRDLVTLVGAVTVGPR